MKKIGFHLFILAACLISSNTLAEWSIPGAHCVSIDDYTATYSTGSVVNMTVRADKNSPSYLQVACSSPMHTSYGNNLDMDFFVDQNSGDQAVSCKGYALDEKGWIVQDTTTAYLAAGQSQINVKITATGGSRYNNNKPVTVVAICSIPDHGYRNCDTCQLRWSPSGIDSIRVY